MTAPLAEVVLWGNETVRAAKLARERDTADRRTRVFQMEQFFIEHGPRLIAVAEAALKMRRVYDYAIPILIEGPGGTAVEIEADTMISEADAAFDAAARGEKAGV